jgi:hypothetical protein
MTKGFWTLLDELGPSLPEGGDIEWTATLDTIMIWLNSCGFRANKGIVETALDSAAQWNPGWPWRVERTGDRYRFTPLSK